MASHDAETPGRVVYCNDVRAMTRPPGPAASAAPAAGSQGL